MYVFPTSMDDRLMDVSCRRAALSPLLQRCVPFATSRTPEYEWKWKSLDRRSLSVSFAWLGDSDFKFLQLDAFFFFFFRSCAKGGFSPVRSVLTSVVVAPSSAALFPAFSSTARRLNCCCFFSPLIIIFHQCAGKRDRFDFIIPPPQFTSHLDTRKKCYNIE